MNLEEERDALRRELQGVQQMLALVLHEVGEPVFVPLTSMSIPANHQVQIVQRFDQPVEEENGFLFALVDLSKLEEEENGQ